MSNSIIEIFVEDHVQQVSTSIKETLRDLYLLRHARDFKFYLSQAQWRVKIFAFFTALFNNMRTLKFKPQPTNAFFAAVNQMFGGSSQLLPSAVIKSNRRVQFRQHSRKLGGAAEHLIDGSEKRICRLRFEF